jgi:hypothetical protein
MYARRTGVASPGEIMATPKSNPKQTSPSVASKASKLLSNPKTPPAVKSVAASDLAQTRAKKKG